MISFLCFVGGNPHCIFIFIFYKNMKKSFLFIMLVVFLAWAWFGGISMAGDEPETSPCTTTTEEATNLHVARITVDETTTSYCTLGEAIDAANNGNTITLLKSVTENITVAAWKEIILDLWWFTLENDGSNNTITNNWTLTVIDGTVDNTVHGKWAIVNNEWWTLTIWDWAIIERSKETWVDAYTSWGNSYYTIHNKWTMTVLEWALIQNNWKYSSCIVNWYPNWATSSTAETSLTIDWWTIKWWVNSVKNDERWVLVVNWWTIINDGWAGIMNRHKWTINDVTVNAVYAFSVWKYGQTAAWVLEINWWDYTASSEIFVEWQYSDNWINVTIKDWSFKGSFWLNNDDITYIINGWKYSDKPEWEYTVPEWQYLKQQDDWTYQLADLTIISTIDIDVTIPVSGGSLTTPTITTTGITLSGDIQWFEWDSTTAMESDKTYQSGTGYKVIIPYEVDTGYALTDDVSVSTWTINTWDKTIIVVFDANEVASWYTVIFKSNGWNEIESQEIAVNWKVEKPEDPKKSNYTFKWWFSDESLETSYDFGSEVTSNITLYAKWEENKSSSKSSWGWGGGGSSKTTTTDDTKATTWDTAKVDENNTEENNEEQANEENKDEEKAPMTDAQAVEKFGQEQIDAYKWALENGITTMKTVEAARLDEPLTRAELAKMMVVYIQKVLEKDPIVTGDVSYSDVDESLGDLYGYIKLAYQYQIMGINADGTPIEFFNPNGLVTRWEYATVFSRVLFGDKFNKTGEDFYTKHLEALKAAWILTNTIPTIQEMRGWVMLMMYRSSQNAEKIENVANTTETNEEEKADEETATASDETKSEANEEEKAEEATNTEATTGDLAETPATQESSETTAENTETAAEATTWDVAEAPTAEASTRYSI